MMIAMTILLGLRLKMEKVGKKDAEGVVSSDGELSRNIK